MNTTITTSPITAAAAINTGETPLSGFAAARKSWPPREVSLFQSVGMLKPLPPETSPVMKATNAMRHQNAQRKGRNMSPIARFQAGVTASTAFSAIRERDFRHNLRGKAAARPAIFEMDEGGGLNRA